MLELCPYGNSLSLFTYELWLTPDVLPVASSKPPGIQDTYARTKFLAPGPDEASMPLKELARDIDRRSSTTSGAEQRCDPRGLLAR